MRAATAISAPVMPIACPHLSAAVLSPMMEKAPGASTAAPIPWTALATIICSGVWTSE